MEFRVIEVTSFKVVVGAKQIDLFNWCEATSKYYWTQEGMNT